MAGKPDIGSENSSPTKDDGVVLEEADLSKEWESRGRRLPKKQWMQEPYFIKHCTSLSFLVEINNPRFPIRAVIAWSIVVGLSQDAAKQLVSP